MRRFASLQGTTVRVVIAQTSTLSGDVTIPVGLEGKVDMGADAL
ncbi:hypothetical protein bAD24_p00830 (plasmid) [Burkholderia sp. AD24]|nr:hypothetical protein bAD24_p00830 [Burkholderia sp. AD24]